MVKSGRNAPCPCGSGSKYKLCCLEHAERERQRVRTTDAIWERLQRPHVEKYGSLTTRSPSHAASTPAPVPITVPQTS